jgi:hypothetical protein
MTARDVKRDSEVVLERRGDTRMGWKTARGAAGGPRHLRAGGLQFGWPAPSPVRWERHDRAAGPGFCPNTGTGSAHLRVLGVDSETHDAMASLRERGERSAQQPLGMPRPGASRGSTRSDDAPIRRPWCDRLPCSARPLHAGRHSSRRARDGRARLPLATVAGDPSQRRRRQRRRRVDVKEVPASRWRRLPGPLCNAGQIPTYAPHAGLYAMLPT